MAAAMITDRSPMMSIGFENLDTKDTDCIPPDAGIWGIAEEQTG